MANREQQARRVPEWAPTAVITLLAAALFTLRLAAPPNLLDQDQERPGTYVLDVVKNGNWLCQRDLNGDITSKPPLYTWLSALVALARNNVDEFSLYLPGALAAWGTAWLLFAFGRELFGTRAALFAALASMLCTAGLKEFGLARTDGVFALTVTSTALLGFRAWIRGKGWTIFWLMAAAATLTKGPLGPVLAAAGFLAVFWERKSGESLPLKGNHLVGVALFLLIAVGWFLLAYYGAGKPLIDKMLGKELVGHSVTDAKQHFPGSLFYQPTLYYLSRGAPWSLFGIYGLWRVWRTPSAEMPVRRFERFLFCWFIFGLLLFSLASHQRGDLLWPIMPAAALLAGRELDRLSVRAPRFFDRAIAGVVVLMLGGFIFYYFGPHARSGFVQQTVALRHIVAEVARYGGSEFPLTHLDDPMGLQVYLNTWHPRVSAERAAELLRGPDPVFIAISDRKKLETARQAGDAPIYTVIPSSSSSNSVRIVSNVQTLDSTNRFAFGFGNLTVRASGVRLAEATEREFSFIEGGKQSEITIVNESSEPRKVRLRIVGEGPPHREERFLASREIWRMKFFAK
jgi:4-amino-4-deoxy-L-arabinose transferase-like glycosyltransferase